VSFWSRLLLLLRMRAHHELDGVEDPREALDLAYSRQLQLQAKMRRAVADVVTARKRIELQGRQLEGSPGRLEEHARIELEQGRQDLARQALLRRAVIRGELGELQRQSSILAAEEARLVAASKRLELQIQQFRIRREAVKAAYVAARARAEVDQVLAGLSQDDAELRLAVERAEHRIAAIRARTAGVDGLLTREALGSGAWTSGTLESELDIPAADAEAAAELARLEGDLLWGRESDPGSGRDS
jgi:phage shock protein A